MQIPPSTHLLQALSRPVDPNATAVRKPSANDAARAAARAVFAQINNAAPVAGQPVKLAAATAPAPQSALQALPSTPPTKPMPRGSLLNILV